MTLDEIRRTVSSLERAGRWDEAIRAAGELAERDEIERVRRRIETKRTLFARMDRVVREAGASSFVHDGAVVVERGAVTVEILTASEFARLPLLFRVIDAVRDDVERELGIENADGIGVRVYDSRSRVDTSRHPSVLAAPGWSAAVADGFLRLFVGGRDVSDPGLAALVGHETVHLLVARTTRGRCPRWLDEGLAIRFTQQLPEQYASRLERAIAERRTLPLDLLSGPFEAMEQAALIDLAYAQSDDVVRHLLDTRGGRFVGKLLRDMGEGSALDAFTLASLSPWLLEREWLRARERGSNP